VRTEDLIIAEATKQEKEKYNILYNKIVECFEKDQIYKKQDISMAELAEMLDTNISYIYYALKQQGIEDNFSTFCNKYRIKHFKERINKGDYKQYTINFLYESSGFKHQSSFNKIFKKLEGITPSEYIAMRKSKKS
jgi:YesN/AraC family two-component response regulator